MSYTREAELESCAQWLLSFDRSELDGAMLSGIKSQEIGGKTPEQIKLFLLKNYRDEIVELTSFNNNMGSFFEDQI